MGMIGERECSAQIYKSACNPQAPPRPGDRI